MRIVAPLFALLLTLPAAATAQTTRADAATRAAPVARFDWFEYSGRDSVYQVHRAGPGQFLNPILAGFYPDPSLTRAGNDYYLISSTFAYFPGIPIFRSRDLVNWTQIGNVIHRPEQLKFDTLGMSRGVFAPTIEHHNGDVLRPQHLRRLRGQLPRHGDEPRRPVVGPGVAPHGRRDRPVDLLRRRRKGVRHQQRRADRRLHVPGTPRDLDPRVRSRDQEGEGPTHADHQWRRGHHAEADLDRGAAHLQDQREVLPELRRGWDGRRSPAGGLPQRQRARALRACAGADQPDPDAASSRSVAAVPRHLGRATPTSCRRRTANGGESSSPRGHTTTTTTTSGARPS